MAKLQTVKEAETQRKNRANEVHPKITTLETELVKNTEGLSGLAKTKAQLGVIKKYADQIKYSPADKSSKPRLDECISSIVDIIEKGEIVDESRVRLSREQSEDREIIDAIVNKALKSCVTNRLNADVRRHYRDVIGENQAINRADKTLDAIENSDLYTKHKTAEKGRAAAQTKAEENQDREEFVFVAKPDVLEPKSTQKTQSLSMFQRIKNALTRTKSETSTNIRANRASDGQSPSRS
jgi:hypothetical protein